jgi:dTMP kinase
MPHPFVVFEGADNAGKSTLMSTVYELLSSRGIKLAAAVAFPSHSPIGLLIRRVLDGDEYVETKALLHLYQADVVHMQPWIARRLEEGPVLCDRYIYSTRVYQRDYHKHDCINMVEASVSYRDPDHLFVVDVPVTVARARGAARAKRPDVLFEKTDEAYMERIRDRYIKLAHDKLTNPTPTTVLDGQQQPAELAKLVLETVRW